MDIASAWSAFAIVPFPDIHDREETDRVCLKVLDIFAAECISTYADNGSLDRDGVRLLDSCSHDLQLMLPGLTGQPREYFDQLNDFAIGVLDRVGA